MGPISPPTEQSPKYFTEFEDMEESSPHEAEAAKYLKEHKILELFANLTAALVYHRPEDPKAFTRDYIQQLMRAKANIDEDPPAFIDESNLISVFSMLDITKKGHISHEQYLKAMKNLAVTQYNSNPAGAELNKISQETFLRESKAAVRAAMSTFIDY